MTRIKVFSYENINTLQAEMNKWIRDNIKKPAQKDINISLFWQPPYYVAGYIIYDDLK